MTISNINIFNAKLEDVIPTPDNPRTFLARDEDDPKLVELAASIHELGVLEPVLVRPHPEQPGKYDLRAGERRWRASRLAGLDRIPCILREMDDRTAALITVTENRQREDLHPLEEAQGIKVMLQRGWSTEDAAAQLGVTAKHITRRNQLNNLSAKWRKWMEENPARAESLSAAHLEMITRYPQSTQDAALKSLDDQRGYGYRDDDPVGRSDIRQAFRDHLHMLDQAPWDLDDEALLPSQGRCSTCTRRSDCQAQLFDPEDFQAKGGKKDKKAAAQVQCLDGPCFQAKMNAFLKAKHAELKKEHGSVITLAEHRWSLPDKHAFKSSAFEAYQIERCKQGAANAKPILHIDGDKPGRVEWGRVRAMYDRKVSTDKKEAKEARAAKSKTVGQKRAELAKERERLLVGMLLESLETFKKAKSSGVLTQESVLRIVVVSMDLDYDLLPKQSKKKGEHPLFWERVDALQHLSADQLLSAILGNELSMSSGTLLDKEARAETCLRILGKPLTEFIAEVERKKPEPKSWAKEEEAAKAKAKPVKPEKPAKGKAAKASARPVPKAPTPGTCASCGCTEDNACVDNDTGETCGWANKKRTCCTFCTDLGNGRNIERPADRAALEKEMPNPMDEASGDGESPDELRSSDDLRSSVEPRSSTKSNTRAKGKVA